MNKKILWITETAAMLALLVALQWLGSQIPEPTTKQLITGSFVNCILVVTTLLAGRNSGIAVALISPVLACIFKIAPMLIAAPIIMVGNVCYVLLLSFILGKTHKPFWKQPVALVVASGVKFAAMYLLGIKLAGGLLLGTLNGHTFAGRPVMTKAVFSMFTWPQLVTALIGGGVALLITPVLRRALRK